MEKLNKVMIAGGGTGGHIYPALAIARALQKIDPKIEIEFVGTKYGMEGKIIPKEGFKLHFVRSAKLNQRTGLFGKIKNILFVLLGLLDSFFLILKNRPAYVLGVGGYASGPFVLVASLMRIKTGIWEPNAMPGMANRWLSKVVDESFLVFEKSKQYLKTQKNQTLGMPIRKIIEDLSEAHKKRPNAQLEILIFCGSQGATRVNTAVMQMLGKFTSEVKKWSFVHQTGAADFEKVKSFYLELGLQAEVYDFIYDMERYYAKADITICRGGASSLAEVAALGLPAIVVPLPAADAHQEMNAELLVKADAGVMILQKDLTDERLFDQISLLAKNSDLRDKMSQNVRAFYKKNAAGEIAQKINERILNNI